MSPRLATTQAKNRVLILACLIFISGCATQTPVGVDMVSSQESYQRTYANPLNQQTLSDEARYVLNRHFLLDQFSANPADAITSLHALALQDDRRDILYALAEMSYLYGSDLSSSGNSDNKKLAADYFLLSALYVYYSSFDKNRPPLSPYSTSRRNALDMYNYGLWQAFANQDDESLELKPAKRKLPTGQIVIDLDASQLPWKLGEIKEFLPADKYMPRGVSVINRTAGVGMPLIGIKDKKYKNDRSMGAWPATAFLRIHGGLADLHSGKATATLELYPAREQTSITVKDRSIPLVTNITTPLAYNVEGTDFFDLNLGAFLGREPNKIPDGLYTTQAYDADKTPVVLVHGTASNPAWWIEMLNTLLADPQVQDKYQFWYFVYNSSKGAAYSAADLRDSLHEKVSSLDPEGANTAMQQMVIIGHSQGGLLTKLTAVDTGDRLVQAMTGKDLDSIDLSPESKDSARRLMVIEPLPFVKTAIFMSTPHRGSFRSKQWVRNLLTRLVRLPETIYNSSQEYYEYISSDVKRIMGIDKGTIFTSADSMSPDNPLLLTLAEIPLAPNVDGHSIIAVSTEGDPKQGNDGVVEYSSAHLEGMKSEFIVRSDHSSQLNPLAIDEVRRILVEKLEPAPSSE